MFDSETFRIDKICVFYTFNFVYLAFSVGILLFPFFRPIITIYRVMLIITNFEIHI